MQLDDYFAWLLDLVGVLHGNHLNYILLMRHLHSKTYKYSFYSDSNRAKAGILLRTHYAYESGIYLDDVFGGECTVLEMLVGLANRLMYDVGREDKTTEEWFWELMSNFGLDVYSDEKYDANEVDYILDRWMDHKYMPDGTGSPFKMDSMFTGNTQTMDVWDQMNLYLTRRYAPGNWLG